MTTPFSHGKGIGRETAEKMFEKWKQEVEKKLPHGIRSPQTMIQNRGKTFHCPKCGGNRFRTNDLHYGPWECRECGKAYTQEQIETITIGWK